MGNNGKTFKTVVFEDGTHAVVRTDPRKPHLLEVIAIFYDASRARFYADRENSGSAEELSKITPQAAPKKEHRRADWSRRAQFTPARRVRGAPRKDGCERTGRGEGRYSGRSGTHTARIAPFGSAIAGEEKAHQNRACRLRTSTGRLPSAVNRDIPLHSALASEHSASERRSQT